MLVALLLTLVLFDVGLAQRETAESPPPRPFLVSKSLPKFSYDSEFKLDNLLIHDHTPPDTDIMTVIAFTDSSLMPITYSLIDAEPYFRINATTGIIKLINPIEKPKFQFIVAAANSASYPHQQTAYHIANVKIMSSELKSHSLQDLMPRYMRISEVSQGDVIYERPLVVENQRITTDPSRLVYCDDSNPYNPDSRMACDFFNVEVEKKSSNQDVGDPESRESYRLMIKLKRDMDYSFKRNFILSLKSDSKSTNSENSNVLIELAEPAQSETTTTISVPKFSLPVYYIIMPIDLKISSSVLEVVVLDVEPTQSSKALFLLQDPNSLFEVAPMAAQCIENKCTQKIILKRRPKILDQYQMELTFMQMSNSASDTTISVPIEVIVTKPTRSSDYFPKFSQPAYRFDIEENFPINKIARHANILINNEYQTDFSEGFTIDLLNTNLSPAGSEVFELVPSFGIGSLISSLRVKSLLDYEKGPRRYEFVIKATSSSQNMISYANLTIHVTNANEFPPRFDRKEYHLVLNEPEKLHPLKDVLVQVSAYDPDDIRFLNEDDSFNFYEESPSVITSSINYMIVGPYQRKFQINKQGEIRLATRFNFLDPYSIRSHYNLTIAAVDSGGLSELASVIIFLNTTFPANLIPQQASNTLLTCSGLARSELNRFDRQTIVPGLFINVNSEHTLQYQIAQSEPFLNELAINENTGEIYFKSPLNSKLLNTFDKILISVKVYQLQHYKSTEDNIYFYSTECQAIIYLSNSDLDTVRIQRPSASLSPPWFIQKYSVVISHDKLSRSVPVVKVEAVSRNSNNSMSLIYTLVDDYQNVFMIDAIDGFIYLRQDTGLEPGVYSVMVKVTDQIENLSSVTKVQIAVVSDGKRSLICNTDYLVIHVTSDKTNTLGRVKCFTNKTVGGNSEVFYELSLPQNVFDCGGRRLENVVPRIGINSTTGDIVALGSLRREEFCDCTYYITARKDDHSKVIPVKLYLVRESQSRMSNQFWPSTTTSSYGSPVFISNSYNYTVFANYLHIGSYIGTVLAYDPVYQYLVQSYQITSQIYNSTNVNVFCIDSAAGVIFVNYPVNIGLYDLEIKARTYSGLTSYIHVYINVIVDFKTANLEIGANQDFTLSETDYKSHLTNRLYKMDLQCSFMNIRLPCKPLNYTLNHLNHVDSIHNISRVYSAERSGQTDDREIVAPSGKQTVILNAMFNQLSGSSDRFIGYIQKNVTIVFNRTQSDRMSVDLLSNNLPRFEYPSYSVNLLDSTPRNTQVLSIRYLRSWSSNGPPLVFRVEKVSNLQCLDYYDFVHDASVQMVNLVVKNTPLPLDKTELTFLVSISGPSFKSYATVLVNVYSSSSQFQMGYPIFTMPIITQNVINLNLNNYMPSGNNTIIPISAYVPSPFSCNITFRIANQIDNLFYIDSRNNLKIVYPFPDIINMKRFNYIIFIQAQTFNQGLPQFSYSAVDIRLILPQHYFTYRSLDQSHGALNLFLVNYNQPVLFDLRPHFGHINLFNDPLTKYFYVYENAQISNRFYVDPFDMQLKHRNYLNCTSRLDFRNLIILITYEPIDFMSYSLNSCCSRLSNTYLMVVNIKFTSVSCCCQSHFFDHSKYIIVEEKMSVGQTVGYMTPYTRTSSMLTNLFSQCELMQNSQSMIDYSFCQMFTIDETSGLIALNRSTFTKYLNGHFVLNVTAQPSHTTTAVNIWSPAPSPSSICPVPIRVLVADSLKKARFVFAKNRTTCISSNLALFQNLKREINNGLNAKFSGLYYFDFYNFEFFNSSSILPDFNACFYVVQTRTMTVVSFSEAKFLISSLSCFNQIKRCYSILDIEACQNRNECTSSCYERYAIGVLSLIGLLILLALLALCVLCCCYGMFMRQSVLAPCIEIDVIEDNCSNNILIEKCG